MKKQLVTFAAFSLTAGIVILACPAVHLGIKKAFSEAEKTHWNVIKIK